MKTVARQRFFHCQGSRVAPLWHRWPGSHGYGLHGGPAQGELLEYVAALDEHGPYDRMFYVFHSGEANTDDDRVTVVGPEKLAELILDAGIVNWLVRKVS